MLINHDFPQDFPPLTARQAQVLACLGDHMTTKEIARTLDISPSMVDQHLRAISHKMGGLPRRKLARLHADSVLRTVCRSAAAPTVLPDCDASPLSQPRMPQPVWDSCFIAGFLLGLASGILVALTTIVSVRFLLGLG